jgi:T5SS/PEP-CTERM-associated repeat protein
MKTKSTSPVPRTLARNVILLAITCLALHLSTAFGATTTWTDGTSSWFTPTNWDHGEPDPSTDAQINNGGTAQIIIDVPQAVALSLTLGLNSDQSGTVQVSAPHGGLSVGQVIFVGYRGKGDLAITDGDSVMSASASIASRTNGLLPASRGSVTLSGGGLWTVAGRFDVGGYNNTPGGVALLSVTNGSTVSAGSIRVYTSGTLTGDSTVSTTSGTTVDGTVSRTVGTLTIGGGLSLTSSATTQCNVTPQDLNTVDISVSGAATLTGRVSVTMTGTFTPCTQFTLLHATGGVLGTFQTQSINYPPGQGFLPVITYGTNDVYLLLESSNGCH